MIRTAIVTVSDTRTEENDGSGRALMEMLPADVFEVCGYKIVKDEIDQIAALLTNYADREKLNLVITTGGTGLSPRDVTPEATRQVIDRELPDLAAFIKMEGAKITKRALLSRGVAGVRRSCLIINLPGSRKGAVESLGFILDVIPHALQMVGGGGH